MHAVAEEEKEHSGSPHWEYAGELGPEQWAELEGCSACNGEHQSPVNIIRTDTQPDSQANWPLVLRYPAETTIHSVVNNGHSIQYDFDRGDQLDFADNTYDLMQFHFHEPSEHTLNGIRYPIEMHLVHYNQEIDEYVVLAVVGYEGTPSDAYAFLEQYLPLQPGESRDIDKPFNLRTALPDSLTPRFHYRGSLTTPPCTESVNWIVFEEPFMLSHEQVVELQRVMPFNNYRGTQPLNDRQVSLIVH
ncbi:MAG: carbonic anhydrase family protein [Halieaceae bacterium]|nr:carbonic anhydrase family protein [Halieaceae bacterium]